MQRSQHFPDDYCSEAEFAENDKEEDTCLENLSSEILQELQDVLKKCTITISNYVLTVIIKMDREASTLDPRICREESCTYVPEPFASYLTSLESVRKPSGPTINPIGDMIEDDPWVFAMLCGLKSIGDKSRQKMTKAVIKQLRTGGIIEERGKEERREDEDESSDKKVSAVSSRYYTTYNTPRNALSWTNDIDRRDDADRVISLSSKNYGQEHYVESPVDRFQLSDLVFRFRKYNAKCITPKFAAVILRSYMASFSVFSPGKGVCTGSRTDLVGQYVIMKNIALLRKLGFPRARLLSRPLTPQNVVATFFLPFRINIDLLREKYQKYCTRTVTIFPGATVRFPEISPAAQLVFNSGKIVTMGGKSPSDHIRALIYTLHRYWLVRAEEPKDNGISGMTIQDFRNPSSSEMQAKFTFAEDMEIFPLSKTTRNTVSASESNNRIGTKRKRI
jgi:TATA-box binding protein (TBP) (component of TFIID and TFIIIB)